VLVIRFTLADKDDKDAPVVSRARFVGDNGDLYVTPDRTFAPDYTTPLLVLGARHAFEVARRAGAAEYAPTEWREVDVKLAALEQTWPDQRNDEAKFSGPAREVTRLADGARRISTERAGGAAASATLAHAADDVERRRRRRRTHSSTPRSHGHQPTAQARSRTRFASPPPRSKRRVTPHGRGLQRRSVPCWKRSVRRAGCWSTCPASISRPASPACSRSHGKI
jgi:hypothetical protein